MSFIRIYLRVLGLLRSDARLAVTLALANIALAAAQFVEPVLFGRIVDALSGALPAGVAPAARALAPLVGAWVGFGLFVIVAGSAGRLVRRPAFASAPQHGAGGLFRARAAIAARLSRRRPFRPADESDADRHRHAMVAVALLLPRASLRLRLYRLAAAGFADLELAAGFAADRAVRSVHGLDGVRDPQILCAAARRGAALFRSRRDRGRCARQCRAGAELRPRRARSVGAQKRRELALERADAGIVVVGHRRPCSPAPARRSRCSSSFWSGPTSSSSAWPRSARSSASWRSRRC